MDIRHGQRLPMRKELLFFFSVLYWMSCIPRNIDENAAKNILHAGLLRLLLLAFAGTVGHTGTSSDEENASGQSASTRPSRRGKTGKRAG